MRLLLDTQIVFWLTGPATRLSGEARASIEAAETVYATPVSILEIAIKNRLAGRAQPFGVAAAVAARWFEAAGLIWAPLDWRHAAQVESLPALHGDPFDRLIAAQAIVEGLRLLTHDRTLAAYDPSFIHV